jgi:hypothetical protein
MYFLHEAIMQGNEAGSGETWRLARLVTPMAGNEKRQRMMLRCLCTFMGLFRRRLERIVAQILRDLCVTMAGWKDFVAFPAAQGNRANPHSESRFPLKDF